VTFEKILQLENFFSSYHPSEEGPPQQSLRPPYALPWGGVLVETEDFIKKFNLKELYFQRNPTELIFTSICNKGSKKNNQGGGGNLINSGCQGPKFLLLRSNHLSMQFLISLSIDESIMPFISSATRACTPL
jgi:hypothetical protein